MNTEVLQESELFQLPARLTGLTEPQIIQWAGQIASSIKESGNVLAAVEQIKAIETALDLVKKDKGIIDEVREEAAKYGKTGFTSASGNIIKLGEFGNKYDYGPCNDPELVLLNESFNRAKKALEERQEFLKKLPEAGLPMVDKESGEEYSIYKPQKHLPVALV